MVGRCWGMRFAFAFACFALIRRWRDTFPTRGKAATVIPLRLETASELRWNGRNVSTVRPPSSGADAPPSPSKGKASFGCANLFCSASHLIAIVPSNRRCIYQLRTAVAAFPFEGEGGASAPDEGGRTGLSFIPPHHNSNAVSNVPAQPKEAFPRVVEGKLQAVCAKRRMRAKSASGTTSCNDQPQVTDEGGTGERTALCFTLSCHKCHTARLAVI